MKELMDYSFSTYAKFPKKLTFLDLRVRIKGKKCSFFEKF